MKLTDKQYCEYAMRYPITKNDVARIASFSLSRTVLELCLDLTSCGISPNEITRMLDSVYQRNSIIIEEKTA